MGRLSAATQAVTKQKIRRSLPTLCLIYKSASIPALTGTSFVDDLTRGNEFYFRAQTTSSLQGRSIAEYLRAVMKEPKVHLVHSRDRFGSSFLQGFAQAYEPGLLRISGLEIDSAGRIGPMTELLEALAGQSEPGFIVVGTGADYIADIVKAVAPSNAC